MTERIGINMEVCPTCLGAGWIYQEGTEIEAALAKREERA
jgi:Zn-finger nucleic acid-binding protein